MTRTTVGSAGGHGRGSPRFALGLLVYLLLSVATFALVYRYAIRVAALYDYDIQNVWVQFGLYFAIYFAFTIAVHWLLASTTGARPGARPETALRAALIAGLTLDAIVATYQSRFGPLVGVNYLVVGALGAFAGALELTRRRFGLVEVISRPPAGVESAVERSHAGVALANGWWDKSKRVIELGLALLLVVVSLPISIPLAMVLWLQDPGPLLVAKVAVKRGGKSFAQYKLRTMVKDAEGRTGPVPAAPEDRRVTRLGGLLRRTHIDELSQVVNIARGDMSLVGPRPERTVFVRRHLETIPNYGRRHAVRPGLAGLAQVFGDYYSTPRQKLRYDLLYVRRRSFGLDIRLFLAAVVTALFGVRPGRRGHRRRGGREAVREEERWRRAYEALRGEVAPIDGREDAS